MASDPRESCHFGTKVLFNFAFKTILTDFSTTSTVGVLVLLAS